ncbi:hypothetical protein [Gloeobacter morelensis]|nr:hypothetical protein [Gloeobacter morelensis]
MLAVLFENSSPVVETRGESDVERRAGDPGVPKVLIDNAAGGY